MADVRQNEQGAWVISGISFGSCSGGTQNVPGNLKVPITLYYPEEGQNGVDVTIETTPKDVPTPWETGLGTELEISNIVCKSGATVLGDKRYIVNGIDWCAVKPFNPEPEPVITHKLVVSPKSVTFNESTGTTSFTATYITYEDGVEKSREDVSENNNVWSYPAGITTNVLNVFTFNNTAETPATVTITATYAGESDSADVNVAGVEPTTHILEIIASTTSITHDGYASFSAYTRPDNTDVTTGATFVSSSSVSDVAIIEGNVLRGNNTGETDVNVAVFATYDNLTSNTVTVEVEGTEPVQRTLEIVPSTTSIAHDGSAVFTAYTRPDNIDVTTDALFTSSSSISDVARLDENVLYGNNTGETSVNVDVFATYDNLTSNTVTVEVDGTGETPTSHTLTIIPEMTTLVSNVGDVQFDVKYDGVSVTGATLSIVCDWPAYTDLGNYLVHFYNQYGLELVAKVTAQYNGLTSNEATVTIPYPLSLTITPDYTTIMCNGEMAYTVRNGGIDVTQQTTFEITASTVVDFAEMNGNVLTAFNSGNTRTAYVVATYNGQSVEATIIIEECALENWLVIVPSNSEIPYNGSQEYAAFLYSRFSGNVGQPDDDPEVRNVTTQTTFTTNNPDDTTIYQSHPNVVIAKNSDVEPKFADITATYNDLTAVASLEIGQFNPQNEVNLGSTDEKYYYTIDITVNEDLNVPVGEYDDRKDVAWKTDASYYYEYYDPHSGEHGQNTGETHYISFSGVGYTVLWNDSGNIGDDPGTVRYEIDPEVTYVALKDFENTTECWDNPDYTPDANNNG